MKEYDMTFKQAYCPCGGIILADTEDWKTPLCDECYTALGEPKEDPEKADRTLDRGTQMKEYEKLAREYVGLNPIYSPTDERDSAAIRDYISGFLKAREMASNIMLIGNALNRDDKLEVICRLGEKEV